MKNIGLISLIFTAMLSFSACSTNAPSPSEDATTEVLTKSVNKADLAEIEKDGFLTTQKCAEAGAFQDCYLQNYICGSDDCYKKYPAGVYGDIQVVLYSHSDGIIYKIDTTDIKMSDLDSGINRNEVTIIGKYDESTHTIYATEFKAPPPPKKSFFKGCL